MSNNWQYIVALICIFLGCFILWSKINKVSETEEVIYGDYTIENVNLSNFKSLKFSSLEIDSASIDLESNILLFFFIKSKLCHPCINNIMDFHSLLNSQEYSGIKPYTFFVDSNIDEILLFKNVLDYDYLSTKYDSSKIQSSFKDYSQTMIFIDVKKEKIILKRIIPGNSTTDISYKTEILNKALEISANLNKKKKNEIFN